MADAQRCRIGGNNRRPGASERGKGLVAAVSDACTVSGYNSKMTRGVGTQARDVRANSPVRIPRLSLGGSCGSVAGRRSILEINGGGQSMRINRAVQCG